MATKPPTSRSRKEIEVSEQTHTSALNIGGKKHLVPMGPEMIRTGAFQMESNLLDYEYDMDRYEMNMK